MKIPYLLIGYRSVLGLGPFFFDSVVEGYFLTGKELKPKEIEKENYERVQNQIRSLSNQILGEGQKVPLYMASGVRKEILGVDLSTLDTKVEKEEGSVEIGSKINWSSKPLPTLKRFILVPDEICARGNEDRFEFPLARQLVRYKERHERIVETVGGLGNIAVDILFKKFAPSPTTYLGKLGMGLLRVGVMLKFGGLPCHPAERYLEDRADRIGFNACVNKERALQELKAQHARLENQEEISESARRIQRLEALAKGSR